MPLKDLLKGRGDIVEKVTVTNEGPQLKTGFCGFN